MSSITLFLWPVGKGCPPKYEREQSESVTLTNFIFRNTDLCDLFLFCSGIHLLGGSVTDAMEATALTFNTNFIDIDVCSWGPRDD